MRLDSMEARTDIPEWLLEPKDASVRFRTLPELLGRGPTDREVKASKAAIPDSSAASALFDAMRPDGSWNYACRQKDSRYLFFVMTSLSWAASSSVSAIT